MAQEYFEIVFRLVAALVAGGLIGLERSYRGRAAGFRTHALVCVASSLLMLVTVYQDEWIVVTSDAFRTDPTRMAQGIMTGIGFLGAGVIFKEGLSVRGLTTAASIWVTAAIGILIGVGFWYPAILGVAATLSILALFRFIEAKMPHEYYAHHELCFARDAVMTEDQVREMLKSHGFSIANLSSQLISGGAFFEYRVVLKTHDPQNTEKLSQQLRKMQDVKEFRIAPTGD